jgi:hypothetical protein
LKETKGNERDPGIFIPLLLPVLQKRNKTQRGQVIVYCHTDRQYCQSVPKTRTLTLHGYRLPLGLE